MQNTLVSHIHMWWLRTRRSILVAEVAGPCQAPYAKLPVLGREVTKIAV